MEQTDLCLWMTRMYFSRKYLKPSTELLGVFIIYSIERGATSMSINAEKQRAEKRKSSSLLLTGATNRDVRTLKMFISEESLDENDLVVFSYRLLNDKFAMVIFALNDTKEWRNEVLPKLARTFGEERCRYESDELLTEPAANNDVFGHGHLGQAINNSIRANGADNDHAPQAREFSIRVDGLHETTPRTEGGLRPKRNRYGWLEQYNLRG
ncbi:MAG: hypothetical protein EOM31_13080 [Bacteroidia bacterium]|nr:hypothetical protein [Bacteroidia bacterium]